MSPVNKFPFMPRALSQLIESFRLLPGIGPKTAQKLAFSTLKMSSEQVKDISNSLANIKSEIMLIKPKTDDFFNNVKNLI